MINLQRIRMGGWLNAGTLISLLPVLYLALAGLQHVQVGDNLRGWLVAASSAGLALALALGLGYVGAEALQRIGLSPVALRRLMLAAWAFGLVALSALVTAGHATAAGGLYQTLGPWAYALVWAAVVAAEGLVVAGMLADRLKALEAGEVARLQAELDEAQAALVARDEVLAEQKRQIELAAAEVEDLESRVIAARAERDDAAEVAKAARVNAQRWSAAAAVAAGKLDALRFEQAGELLRRIAEATIWSAKTVSELGAELEAGLQSVRAACDRGVELELLYKERAPDSSGASWQYRRLVAIEAALREVEVAA